MATPLVAPRPGEGVEELNIASWLKKVGDQVEEFEPIVEVETDKVVTEIPSPASGTVLKIEVEQGNYVKVGEVMAWIGEPGEEPGQSTSEPSAPTEAEDKQAEPVQPAEEPIPVAEEKADEKTGEVEVEKVEETAAEKSASDEKPPFLSPLVRKMVEEHQIDVNAVKGTGENGRITKADIEAYLQAPKPKPDAAKAEPAKPAETAAPKIEIPEGGQLVPHSNTRKQIAQRMIQSKLTSPHVLTVMEADMSRVLAHRAANKPAFGEKGINLTLTAYFISAMVQALQKYPGVNASWTDEGLLMHKHVNLGMAVALGEAGLIVPVIKQAENLSLTGIAAAVNDLSERARGKKLKGEDVRDGTITLTNHGTGGSLFASPVINQPQLAILGTGAMQKRAVVITDEFGNDSIAIRPMVYLSLVFDHRALDGEAADNYLAEVKHILENWELPA